MTDILKNKDRVVPDFDKMQQIYTAIRRLDNIDLRTSKAEIIEQTMCSIKDINHNDFPSHTVTEFMNNIRQGLVEVYTRISDEIDKQILRNDSTSDNNVVRDCRNDYDGDIEEDQVLYHE